MFDLMPWKKKKERRPARSLEPTDHFLGRFWDRDVFFPSNQFFQNAWHPSVDVNEGKKSITVKAEISGIDKKDINVSLNGRILTIAGEKKQEKEENDKYHYRMECNYGRFNRSIELPAEVDASKVKAKFKKGVLTVELQKVKESEHVKIEVKTA
jgi:HSP20 family protein